MMIVKSQKRLDESYFDVVYENGGRYVDSHKNSYGALYTYYFEVPLDVREKFKNAYKRQPETNSS